MSDVDLERVVRDYLPGVLHMSLATCSRNCPWSCELHFGYDDDLNLYFRSLRSRRHSREIEANPAIAGSIVVQHTASEPPLGIFFEGSARVLMSAAERQTAFDCLSKRLPLGDQALVDATLPDGYWFYMVAVDKYYIYGGFEGGSRQKYELDWTSRWLQ